MTQNFQTHNEAVNEICSSQFMKSSSAKNTPQTSKDSEQSSTPIISTPKKALENNPEMGCTTPSLVVSISNSVSSPHSTNSIPSKSSFQFCNKKSLEYKESPVVSDMPNHSSQQFSSSNNPIEDSSFPFLFQNNLQANTVGSQPFSLFESPVAAVEVMISILPSFIEVKQQLPGKARTPDGNGGTGENMLYVLIQYPPSKVNVCLPTCIIGHKVTQIKQKTKYTVVAVMKCLCVYSPLYRVQTGVIVSCLHISIYLNFP
ncbi:hypothetical protein E2C01_053763 [Portunus trituberculatus]|uniref:Uncharacterized protein n=1 Tax=Portunus trituberculatus TaxID=210409 RepID=A0A5B7GQY3_PORTR|nr:hypothetical protein [Portunus trituberculatus]